MERTRPTRSSEERSDALDDVPDLAAARPAPPVADGETVAEAEARRVWQVAARLQAEAARRLDARSETLARTHQAEEPRPSAAFTRAEVAQIAEAAGIDPGYVELAWREVEAQAVSDDGVSDEKHARASAFLGTDTERLSVTRIFRASPAEVLAAMERVFPADPYRLTLAEIVGEGDALSDSVLIFDVPPLDMVVASTGSYSRFSYAMTTADLKRLVVTLHALGDGRTEATVSVDVRHGKAKNFTVGAWLTGLFAVAGGAVGGLIGASVGDGGLAMTVGVGAGAAAAGPLSFWGYRAAYAGGLRKGEKAVDGLLRSVDVSLRSGGAFAPPSAPTKRDGAASGLLGDLGL